MGCTYAALSSITAYWDAMAPNSIEQGYDLYIKVGRDRAKQDLEAGKHDLIVAQ